MAPKPQSECDDKSDLVSSFTSLTMAKPQSRERNFEDLWQAAFPVGTEWGNIDKLREIDWDFSNLEACFEDGGVLHGKAAYLFGSTEAPLLNVNSESKVTLIPVVVAVDCPFPPSDKIGIKSVQRVEEAIVPMQKMKMDWNPYFSLKDSEASNIYSRLHPKKMFTETFERRASQTV